MISYCLPLQCWQSGGRPVHDGSDNKTVNGWRGALSDTSSIGSRVTSSSSGHSERARARRLGLFLILIIVAFIIAALIGLLVYFLLTRGIVLRCINNTLGEERESVCVFNPFRVFVYVFFQYVVCLCICSKRRTGIVTLEDELGYVRYCKTQLLRHVLLFSKTRLFVYLIGCQG